MVYTASGDEFEIAEEEVHLYTEDQLIAKYGKIYEQADWKERFKDTVQRKFSCSAKQLQNFIFSVVPILQWLPKYKFREHLIGDVAAGLAVGVVHLPQGMAYALLASLPPITGLYVSFFPVLTYIFFGTSKHVSIGTFAIVSLMIANVVEKNTIVCPTSSDALSAVEMDAATSHTGLITTTSAAYSVNSTSSSCESEQTQRRIELAVALAVSCGIIQIVMAILQMGIVTIYLSDYLISAFTCGAAFFVLTSQVPKLIGISVTRYSGPLGLIYTYIDVFKNITTINWATFIISTCSIVFLIIGKEINARFHDRLPVPIPWELAVVIVSTIGTHFGHFFNYYGVIVVGEIPTGFQPSIPQGSDIGIVILEAIPIAVISFVIEISLAQVFATKHSYSVDSNQELVALGMANIVGSFFSCFPCAASLSRSVIWEEVGSKTQLTGIFSSFLVLIILLWIGPLFQQLPQAALAAIIVVNLKSLLRQFEKIKPLWKVSPLDAITWIVTWLAVIFLGVELGLVVGLGFEIFTVILKTQIPRGSVVGQVEGNYRDVKKYNIRLSPDRKILVFEMSGPLYFCNKDRFKYQLIAVLGFDPVSEATSLKKEKSSQNNKKSEQHEKSKIFATSKHQTSYSGSINGSFIGSNSKENGVLENGYPPSPIAHGAVANGIVKPHSEKNNVASRTPFIHSQQELASLSCETTPGFIVNLSERKLEHVILVMSRCIFVDSDGAKVIKVIHEALEELNIRLSLANVNDSVRESITAMCDNTRPAFFISLDRAMEYASGEACFTLDDLGQVVEELRNTYDTRL